MASARVHDCLAHCERNAVCHFPTAAQVSLWALMFILGVACDAPAARLAQDTPQLVNTFGGQHFGFLPNRNHSAVIIPDC